VGWRPRVRDVVEQVVQEAAASWFTYPAPGAFQAPFCTYVYGGGGCSLSLGSRYYRTTALRGRVQVQRPHMEHGGAARGRGRGRGPCSVRTHVRRGRLRRTAAMARRNSRTRRRHTVVAVACGCGGVSFQVSF
jgi:hypothetical protein